jgi:hypothetical protein
MAASSPCPRLPGPLPTRYQSPIISWVAFTETFWR